MKEVNGNFTINKLTVVFYQKNKLTVVGKLDAKKDREQVEIKTKKVVLVSLILKKNKENNIVRVTSQVSHKRNDDIVAPFQCLRKKRN